jgi:HEPN domain-containing protein
MSMTSYETVSFHAQQAAEKALKGLLARHEVQFDRTHDLGDLLRLTEPSVQGLASRLRDAHDLTPFAVSSRYPGGPVVDRDMAGRHLEEGRRVVEAVEALLASYLLP